MTHINDNINLKLYAPSKYWTSSHEDLSVVANGCGTSGWKGLLVPDTLWGLSVSGSCNIHDWMYHYGKNSNDKLEADRAFLNNMVRTINYHTSNWGLRKLRLSRARTYFEAVQIFGGPAFWDNKNTLEEFKLASDIHELNNIG